MEIQELKQIIEALIFSSEQPLSLDRIQKILENTSKKEIEAALSEIERECAESKRGIKLVKVAGGYQFTTQPQLASWIKKLFKEKEARSLSPSAVETLAIIAYKQPVAKAEIEAIRGVDSGGVVYTLMEKSLVKIVGRREGPGRPLLYGTTDEFLLYVGLEDLSALPKLEEINNKNEAA